MASISKTQYFSFSVMFLTLMLLISSIHSTSTQWFGWEPLKNLSDPLVKDLETFSVCEAKKQQKVREAFIGETTKGYLQTVMNNIFPGKYYKLMIKDKTNEQNDDDVYISIVLAWRDSNKKELKCFSGPSSVYKCG